MRAWFSEEPVQQLGYFSLFIASVLRIENVNAFQASKALRHCSMILETITPAIGIITPAIGISINPLYSSDSFMSILKNTEDSNEMAHSVTFYQCLH